MKILWLSHLVPYPPKGGVLQRAYYLLRETARYHDVTLLAFIQKDLFDIHYESREEALIDCRQGLSFCRDMQFIDIPCDTVRGGKTALAAASALTPAPYTINWLRSGKYRDALAGMLREQQFDVIHFDTISLAPYLELVEGVPCSLDHHNVESQMMQRRAEQDENWLKRLYFNWEATRLRNYERRHCGRFSSNIMCSDLDQERLEEICPGATFEIIPNGVDTNYFSPNIECAKDTMMIFAGRLSAYTNSQAARYVIDEIWPAVKRSMDAPTFKLVGHNPPAEALKLAEADPAFIVTGFVDDVRTHLDRARIYVCPIFDGGGTKLKILDAMAMAMPIVATRVACEGIDLVDNESVLFAETGQEFADAIARLEQDEALRKRLAVKAREIAVNQYSYESIGNRLSRHFEEIQGAAG